MAGGRCRGGGWYWITGSRTAPRSNWSGCCERGARGCGNADKGFDLPDDVAALLAERARGDIRELEGLLSRVLTHARLTDVPATLDHAVEALTALPPASASTPDANH